MLVDKECEMCGLRAIQGDPYSQAWCYSCGAYYLDDGCGLMFMPTEGDLEALREIYKKGERENERKGSTSK